MDKNIREGKVYKVGMNLVRCRVGFLYVVVGFVWVKSLWLEL